jgi:hypothetical protein
MVGLRTLCLCVTKVMNKIQCWKGLHRPIFSNACMTCHLHFKFRISDAGVYLGSLTSIEGPYYCLEKFLEQTQNPRFYSFASSAKYLTRFLMFANVSKAIYIYPKFWSPTCLV